MGALLWVQQPQWNCYFILMRPIRTPKQATLPKIQQKSVSLHSVFDLIRKKKHELSKRLIETDDVQVNLPKINMMRDRMDELPNEEASQQQRETLEPRSENLPQTPSSKYRTILQLASQSEDRGGTAGRQLSQLGLQSKQKKNEIAIKFKTQASPNKRVKTEIADISRKGTNITQMESQRKKQASQADFNRIQDAKEKFLNAVQAIPKAMKMRNEANLLQAVESLQIFNPFANRNNRIVNVCLLKMGRPLILNSALLYKMGEELGCFFIILMGKVKLVNGGLRKVCQTGQTVLQEVIFSDREKKIALQRAKTIGKTVLLEITMDGLKKLKEELTKFGYKLGYQEMQSIIKRNYIVKNWLRNKIRLEANR